MTSNLKSTRIDLYYECIIMLLKGYCTTAHLLQALLTEQDIELCCRRQKLVIVYETIAVNIHGFHHLPDFSSNGPNALLMRAVFAASSRIVSSAD